MKNILNFIKIIIAIVICIPLFLFGAWIGAIAWVFKNFIFFIFTSIFCMFLIIALFIYILDKGDDDNEYK